MTMKNTSDVWQSLEGVCVLQENFIRQKHHRDILGKENQTHTHTPQVKSKYHSAVQVCLQPSPSGNADRDSRRFQTKCNPTSRVQE